MNLELAGKVALVTGAGGLIGSAIARALADEGACIAVADIHEASARATVATLAARGTRTIATLGDVVDAAAAQRMVDETTAALGPVDVLVNCHGVFRPSRHLLDYDIAEWDRFFAINVRGTMLMCQAVGQQLVARAAPGAIVNVSSGSGTIARRGASAYCATKAAVNLLTEVLAIELGPNAIRVNAVAPGLVLREPLARGDTHPSAYVREMLDCIPLGRAGLPDDIARMVVFLASPTNAWVSGEVVYVAGGSQTGRPHVSPADH